MISSFSYLRMVAKMRTKVKSKLPALLVHPVRVRILHALSDVGTATTGELCARLPDVSQATVYRHVAALAQAGVLRAVGETPVRGAVERRYEVDRSRAVIGEKTARGMDRESHRRGFAAAMAALLADFGAYLDQPGASPSADLVGYRQIPIWATPEEIGALVEKIQRLLDPALRQGPMKGRRRYLLSPIVFPRAGTATPPSTRRGKRPARRG
jgi:DNA-binding transcriptional ArsR family regulator